MSSSGISWATCKPAPSSRQITTPAPNHSVFTGRMIFLLPNQQRQSTEGRSSDTKCSSKHNNKLRHGETIICPHRSQQIYIHAQKDPQSAQLWQPGLRAACLAGPGGLRDGQTNRWIAAPLNAPVRRGHNNNNHFTAIIQANLRLPTPPVKNWRILLPCKVLLPTCP